MGQVYSDIGFLSVGHLFKSFALGESLAAITSPSSRLVNNKSMPNGKDKKPNMLISLGGVGEF